MTPSLRNHLVAGLLIAWIVQLVSQQNNCDERLVHILSILTITIAGFSLLLWHEMHQSMKERRLVQAARVAMDDDLLPLFDSAIVGETGYPVDERCP